MPFTAVDFLPPSKPRSVLATVSAPRTEWESRIADDGSGCRPSTRRTRWIQTSRCGNYRRGPVQLSNPTSARTQIEHQAVAAVRFDSLQHFGRLRANVIPCGEDIALHMPDHHRLGPGVESDGVVRVRGDENARVQADDPRLYLTNHGSGRTGHPFASVNPFRQGTGRPWGSFAKLFRPDFVIGWQRDIDPSSAPSLRTPQLVLWGLVIDVVEQHGAGRVAWPLCGDHVGICRCPALIYVAKFNQDCKFVYHEFLLN
jgi:hypothetical protein